MARKRIVGGRIGFWLLVIGMLLNLSSVQAQPHTPIVSNLAVNGRIFEPTKVQATPLTTSSVITGTWNPAFQNNFQLPGAITKLYVDAHDRLYVAGAFNYLNGQEFNGLASWNGKTWQGYGLQPSDPGSILTMNTYNDQLIVGGSFGKLAGQPMNAIARWNGTAFESFGTGFSGTSDFYDYSNISKVHDLDVVTDTLYISGNFQRFNGLAVNSLLAWNPTGYHKVANIDSSVYQFAAANDEILLSGELLSIDQTAVDYFALRQNGVWSNPPMPTNTPFYQEIHVFDNAFYLRKFINLPSYQTQFYHWEADNWVADSSVITGAAQDLVRWNGQFYSASLTNLWQRTTAGWRSIDLPMTIRAITAIESSSSGIYLAGNFTVNGQPSQLVYWNGTTITNLATTIQQNGVRDIGNLNGQPLIITSPDTMIQRWNGTAWQNQQAVPYNTDLVTIDDQHTYVVNSSPFTTTSALKSALWQFTPNGNLIAPVAIDYLSSHWTISGSQLLVGMNSGMVNSQPISGVVAIQDDRWEQILPAYNWDPIYVANQRIFSLDLEEDRVIWQFGLSFWNGTNWQEHVWWNQRDDQGTPQVLTWRDDLYLLYHKELRRLNFDAATFDLVATFDDTPMLLRNSGDDYLYVAGKFSRVDNQVVGPLVRWDGTTWQGFEQTPNGPIYQLAVTPEKIHIGGRFTHVGSTPSLGVASFSINATPVTPTYRQFIPQVSR